MQNQDQDIDHHRSPASALPTTHTKVSFSFNKTKRGHHPPQPPQKRLSATSAFTNAAAMDLEDEDEEEVRLGMEIFPLVAVSAATSTATEPKDDIHNINIEPSDEATAAAEEDEELTTQTQKVQASLQAISLDNKTISSNTNIIVSQQQAQIDALREEGNERALAGNFRAALELFEAALGLDPRNSLLYELKAQSHLQLEEWFEAVKAGRRAVTLAPEWGEGRLTLGRALMQMGEVRDAVKELSRLLGKSSSTSPLHAEAREELIYATGALMELQRREADFDLQLSGRAGLDKQELEVAQCKRNLLARGLDVSSDCFLGGSEGSFGEQEGKHNEQEGVEEDDEEEGW